MVDNHGTGGGFSRYLQGEVDIVDASRNGQGRRRRPRPRHRGSSGRGSSSATTASPSSSTPRTTSSSRSPSSSSRSSGSRQQRSRPGRTSIPSWPDRKIILYTPDNDSGTFEFFTEAIVGKAKSQRDDVQQSSDDNTLVSGVAGDADGIGYFGYAYYAANKEQAASRRRPERPRRQAGLPSPETIADKSYKPLSRPALHLREELGARRPEVKQFLKYYLENVETLAVKGGYDPPTAEDMAANKARWRLTKLFGGDADAGRGCRLAKDSPRVALRARKSTIATPTSTDQPRAPRQADSRLGRADPRCLAFWESPVVAGPVLCAAGHHPHHAGIILVLGVQTVEFFRVSKVGLLDFLSARAQARRHPAHASASCRWSGERSSSPSARRASPCRSGC